MGLKKLTLLLFISFSSLLSCESEGAVFNSSSSCGTHNGNQLHKGPEGGCYYYNSNGNKTYVDRSECNC